MADELRRAVLKTTTILRAQKRCEQALEFIDWKIDTLEPIVQQIKLDAADTLELPEFIITEDNDK